jgi:hypothetical protein
MCSHRYRCQKKPNTQRRKDNHWYRRRQSMVWSSHMAAKPTGIDALAWAIQTEKLRRRVPVTSMDKDGTKTARYRLTALSLSA